MSEHDCARDDRGGDYALLAEAIIEAFNPPDDDVAEEAILIRAVEAARDFIAAQPCLCTPEDIANGCPERCERCQVLGRLGDKVIDR